MITPQPQLNKELQVIRTEMSPVIKRAEALMVNDAQSYAIADTFLGKIVDARKSIKTRLGKFMNPLKEAVDKAKESYKQAQSFHAEVDSPLEQAELVVRDRMKQFKIEEARQARLEEQRREQEEQRLRAEAARAQQAEDKAKTQQMRDRLAAKRAELETQADLAQAAPAAVPVKAVGSTTRTVRIPTVVNKAMFIRALAAGEVLVAGVPMFETLLDIDQTALKQLFKAYPDKVAKWPGIESVDDIQIVHKAGR